MKFSKLLLCVFAFSFMVLYASSAYAQAPQGTYVLRGPDGPPADVTVNYTVTGTSQNPMVNITVSRGNGANFQIRYYRGLRNYPAMDLYNTKAANNGGTFVLSINGAAAGGTLVSVPNYSFYSNGATASTYQNSALQNAIQFLQQDEPVLVALEREGITDIGYTAAGIGHATNNYSRSIAASLQWDVISGPTIPPTTNNLGGCVWWCEFWSWDCTDGERACVAQCESENSGIAVDWRNKCGVPRPWVSGQIPPNQ